MTAADVGPDRLARLREAAGDMDEALREEGFESFGSHAVFVRWQRASVEALAGIVVEAEPLRIVHAFAPAGRVVEDEVRRVAELAARLAQARFFRLRSLEP